MVDKIKKQISNDLTQVQGALARIILPHVGLDLISAQAIQHMAIEEGVLNLKVRLGYPAKHYQETLKAILMQACENIPGISTVNIEISWRINSHVVQKTLKPENKICNGGIKNIIAIASGKGGVGKSTVACNLALAIQAEGGVVGLLDADIHGPSQPWMLGVSKQKPEMIEKRLQPIESYGLKTMSMGYLVDEDTPMVWRGPMISSALQQLLNDTDWGDLDYLIIDLPPGTGDIQLTLAQKIPVSGVVIVTTPQDIALLDAKKALKMFQKVEVSVLGVVENMGVYTCTHCGHQASIFGKAGAVQLKESYDIPLLGELPLNMRIREQGDKGKPIVVAEPEGAVAQAYYELARRVTGELSLKPRNLSLPFSTLI
jgi:ATP-binding protein involved in chromosome partitioning